MIFEKTLIEQCSPTLASLKTANLFSMVCPSEEALHCQTSYWNEIMSAKGISLVVLKYQEQRGLIYVCRKSRLHSRLSSPEVMNFLADFGYNSTDVDSCLEHLKQRLAKSSAFPHEIGIFLDYPLEDVIGFIRNGGRNYKCSGCWKVYCNECEAVKTFARYRKCREVYKRLWQQGTSILQLTVAAG